MNENNQNLCCVVPVYQAERTIVDLIRSIRENQAELPIIVVDDGSTDHCVDILTEIANITLIRHPQNRGKGAALKSGILRARQMGYTHVITIDADLQHPPALMDKFIRKQQASSADLIIGRRKFVLREMPFQRILSNTITSLMISIRIGQCVHDSQCGFRLLRIDSLDIGKLKANGFQFESEYLVRIPRYGFRIAEIDIPTLYREERSSIRNFADTFKFIFLFLKSYIWT